MLEHRILMLRHNMCLSSVHTLCALLMMSNAVFVGAWRIDAKVGNVEVGSVVGAGSKHTEDQFSASEVQEILMLKFSEPLPTVMARVKQNAQSLSLSNALVQVGQKLPKEVMSLVEGQKQGFMAANNSSGPHSQQQQALVGGAEKSFKTSGHSLDEPTVLSKAMGFINKQFIMAREKLDIKLFECGVFKEEKEGMLYATQATLDQIGGDISLADSTIEQSSGEILELQGQLAKLKQELEDHLGVCALIRADLEAIELDLKMDLQAMNLILDTAIESCKGEVTLPKGFGSFLIQACLTAVGQTVFQTTNAKFESQAAQLKTEKARSALQRLLFEVYGGEKALPGHLDLEALMDNGSDSVEDDFPEDTSFVQGSSKFQKLNQIAEGAESPPPAPTKNKAGEATRSKRCPIGIKPNCPVLLDKLDLMKGEVVEALTIATGELNKHNAECKRVSDDLNDEITTLKSQVTMNNVEIAKATARISSLQIDQTREQQIKRELCQELREKYHECYSDMVALEEEMCGLIKIRQIVYNKVKNPDMKPGGEQIIIQDCEMGDWVPGPCSQPCLDAMTGLPGRQDVIRTPIVKWDPTTPEGKFGASCPPSQLSRDCNNIECPIDCKFQAWTGWSECSRECGGGQQGRTRLIDSPEEHGGEVCPAASEERPCNTESCDRDCDLAEWSNWSPCSKACKWRRQAIAGSQKRTKAISRAVRANGKCPLPKSDDRFEHQVCNDQICPQEINCIADMDVIIVLDGSGSMFWRYGPKDRNWVLMKDFAKGLIGSSQMAEFDKEGKPSGGVRFGLITFAWDPVVVSQISNDKEKLMGDIDKMVWAKGGSYVGKALLNAKKLFQTGSTASRHQVVVLVTDGRASNKGKALAATKQVKAAGARLIVVPVKNSMKPDEEAEMCSWSSSPCSENLLKTQSWPDLVEKLKWYLTTMCPVVEAPEEEMPPKKL